MPTIETVLNFWFGAPYSSDYGKRRPVWFKKDPAFDQQVRDYGLPLYERAVAGQLKDWLNSPEGCLALILLFDQFPRNLFRGTAQAFATDAQALAIAERTIEQGFDQHLMPVQRLFVYLPWEHSENLEHQNRSVELFATLKENPETADTFPYALSHRQVIEQFGRFPHRNAILGRVSTNAEVMYLQQPGSGF